MRKSITKAGLGVLLATTVCLATAAVAQDTNVKLMEGAAPRLGDERMTAPNQFKKAGPWKIGMSHFGVNANTWTVQMAHEAESASKQDPQIGQFILLDANINAAKQAADIDALIAQKVDALIITPLTPTSADAGIVKAAAAGIPVIVHTGLTETESYSVDLQGGGQNYGKVMGEFLVKELNGKGNIWVLRGLPNHPEDINRYRGLLESLEGTNVKILAEDSGKWQYDDAKRVCETFFQEYPTVDGIWSEGADMSRACMDVFAAHGVAVPPITGEGGNGFFKQWTQSGARAIAAEYGPEQGAAGVRAAIALLEGKVLHKRYVYEPRGWDVEKAKSYYRDDLADNVWFPTSLTEAELKAIYSKP